MGHLHRFQIAVSPFGTVSREETQPRIQYAAWGTQGNALVMVHENDIYYKTSANSPKTVPITRTGVAGTYFNGITDWLYRGKDE